MDTKKLDIKPLVGARKSDEDVTFPVSDKELCDRYSRVTTPMVNDVLRRMGRRKLGLVMLVEDGGIFHIVTLRFRGV